MFAVRNSTYPSCLRHARRTAVVGRFSSAAITIRALMRRRIVAYAVCRQRVGRLSSSRCAFGTELYFGIVGFKDHRRCIRANSIFSLVRADLPSRFPIRCGCRECRLRSRLLAHGYNVHGQNENHFVRVHCIRGEVLEPYSVCSLFPNAQEGPKRQGRLSSWTGNERREGYFA